MTLTQMEYFQAVCKYENFTKAAQAVHISQPALSSTMKKLEEECGLPLFLRHKNQLQITPEGRVLLREVDLFLAHYEQLGRIVSELALRRRYVRIGMSTLCGNMVYPDLLEAYRAQYPQVEVMSVEEGPSRLFGMLESGQLDLVIAGKEGAGQEYGTWRLADSCRLFCVSKDDPLAKEERVTFAQIAQKPLIVQEDHVRFLEYLKGEFQKRDLRWNIVHATRQIYTIERFVERGIACGFLLKNTIDKNPGVVGLPYEGMISVNATLFWRRENCLPQTVRDFIRLAKRLYPAPGKGRCSD